MLMFRHGRRIAAAWHDVERVLCGTTWPAEIARARVGGVDDIQPVAEKSRADSIERVLRFTRHAPVFPAHLPLAPMVQWDEESVFVKPARRVEYVVIPRDTRIAALIASKGVVHFEPASVDETRVDLEGRVHIRLPGVGHILERRLAAAVQRMFDDQIDVLASGARAMARGESLSS